MTDKTKEEHIKEIKLLQKRIAELEILDSERKKAQEAVKKSEEYFRAITENILDIIIIVDKKGVINYITPSIECIAGYRPEEIVGKSAFDFIHPADLSRAAVDFAKALMIKETNIPNSFRVRHKDGSERILEGLGKNLLDNPAVVGFVMNVRDITKRKQAEAELKRSEQELREEKLLLEQKNLALKELLEHMERTKNKTKEDIGLNVEELIMPILRKLELKEISRKYTKLLRYHLDELVSSFGRKITAKSTRLSPKETEICSMLKGGLSSKEISELLNVSYQTIDKHRRNIRKKLAISKKKVNLTTFLQKL